MLKKFKDKNGQEDYWTDDKYILNDKGEAVLEHGLLAWGRWMENGGRVVAKTEVGRYEVSTVFLGLDYSFTSGPPVLFETMVFEKGRNSVDDDGFFDRYTSRQDALVGHMHIVELVKKKAGVQ